MEQYTNSNRDFMNDTYKDNKLSKDTELNSTMSISQSAPDKYEQTQKSVGGQTND